MKKLLLILLIMVLPFMVYGGAVYDPILGKMRMSDDIDFTTVLGEAYDSENDFIALSPTTVTSSVADGETITLTAGYKEYDISLTQTTASTGAVYLPETGIIDGAIARVYNAGTYAATFPFVSGQQEFNGGTTGLSLTLEAGGSLAYQYKASRWNLISNESSTVYFKSIELPTLDFAELNGTSSPHALLASELKGSLLTNAGATGEHHYDFPARTEGWNFIFVIEAAQNVVLDPNGTEAWYLNGAQMANGENIVNLAADVGDTLTCLSTETAVYCTSNDADWAQETPPE